mmetsp:Transcript_1854/g.6012  ORF Transcript_1854/g.6012 Transcript_1854/m.6012 type:complete len:235 (-) Transcript_1854:611-1315(-)
MSLASIATATPRRASGTAAERSPQAGAAGSGLRAGLKPRGRSSRADMHMYMLLLLLLLLLYVVQAPPHHDDPATYGSAWPSRAAGESEKARPSRPPLVEGCRLHLLLVGSSEVDGDRRPLWDLPHALLCVDDAAGVGASLCDAVGAALGGAGVRVEQLGLVALEQEEEGVAVIQSQLGQLRRPLDGADTPLARFPLAVAAESLRARRGGGRRVPSLDHVALGGRGARASEVGLV